ncbi:cell division protein FtsZ [Acidovorax sp. HDW3]|uniref:cell division protein ZipA C-terminal FtsZ-binding domain-containing protein n=1 Tax=Acidovorax sp. HDW3 TaxID=2714923 RepID=UPI00140A7613|nr:cell division protein ZipA C-terminal FtsZ-binding domain-containing protein [Acidovorax sp. HDW3]QIL43857.1 cell division protein FtsZ [Acidovorax sp. HDW3]
MSTLQLSLAIIGGIVLAVIVAYNAWNTHRNQPRRAQPESAPVPPPEADEALAPGLRAEPAFDAPFGASGVPVTPASRREPGLAEAPAGAMGVPPAALERDADDEDAAAQVLAASAAHAAPVHDALLQRAGAAHAKIHLDPLIDAMASLLVENLVSGEAALAAMPPTQRAGSKPFAIEGFNASSQLWEAPQPGQRYMAFQAGVQLANRTGALTQIEFSEFVAKTQAFCDSLGAAPEFPDMAHEVARARELDQFASGHDAQLSFLLCARQAAWSPGYVQQSAARLGFVAGAMPGLLQLPSSTPGHAPLLQLSFDQHAALADDMDQSAVRELNLSLDVPQVARAERPLERLREVAQALADSMDALLCDQDGTPLPSMAMDAIAADLEQLYDLLDGRELCAGSPLARRLFS